MRKECVVSCITKLSSINNNIRKKERSYSLFHSLSLFFLFFFYPTCSTTHHHSHPHFVLFVDNNILVFFFFSLLLSTYILRFNPHLLPSQHSFLTINVHTILSNKLSTDKIDKMTLSYF